MSAAFPVSQRFATAIAVFFGLALAWLLAPSPGGSLPSSAQTSKALWRPADLLSIAADAPTPVAELFRALARPSDRVRLADGEIVAIEPLGPDALLDQEFVGNITAQAVTEPNKAARQLVLTKQGVAAYVPYERQALERMADFEKAAGDLPARERWTALETALAVVLRYSSSTRERPLKGPGRWEPLQTELNNKLLEVRRRLLRQGTTVADSGKEWQQALAFGDELVAAYPANLAVLTDVAHQRTRHAAWLLLHMAAGKQASKAFADIRRDLEWIEERLPQPPRPAPWETVGDELLQAGRPFVLRYHADSLRRFLADKASALRVKARQSKDVKTAIKLLETAQEIWPRLPGLRDDLLKRQDKYTILYVGVRKLPEHFSPAHAANDAELQALELLFESLVQTRPANDGSLAPVPQLASSLPPIVDGERQFLLRKTAYWSNGVHVTSADVQRSFELLTRPQLPGHSAELTDQVEPIRAGDDPFRVTAKLRQGLLEPLAPFAFKVLPREYLGAPLASADDEAFAAAPLGSGRYMLAGRMSEHGRDYVRFVANPYYFSHTEPDGPKIREVRFFVPRDPAADFADQQAPLHLLLDVPTQNLGKLKAAGVKDLRTLRTRRVWFLAVNHRNPLLADDALRRAMAHGINRDQVLADCFGDGRPNLRPSIAAWASTAAAIAAGMQLRGATPHHALNGPFPAESWANCPDNRVPASLFDRALGERFLKASGSKTVDLELKYPDDDPRVGQACKMIAAQLSDLGNRVGRPIKVKLVALPPHQLMRDVQQRRYQLAFWHHDFPNDVYSLWPLFDPREQALLTGSNYLGYKDDGTLPELLQKAASYRAFNEVQRLTHDIHVVLFERMPLIPLWELDYHLAVHPQLVLPRVDPLRVFANVEEWRLEGN